jgi:hypothetical protein
VATAGRKPTFSRFVSKAFGETATPASDDFLRELRINWREGLSRTRRVGVLLTLSSILFVLLLDARVSEIAFSGIKLSPGAVDIVATALPAVVAYLFAQYLELHLLLARYEVLHLEICHQLYPDLHPLDRALHPPETDNDLNLYAMTGVRYTGWGQRLRFGTAKVGLLVTLVLPFALVVGAYAALLITRTAPPLAFVLSAVFSLFFLLRGASILPLARDLVVTEVPAP